jgi:hypothetical protein
MRRTVGLPLARPDSLIRDLTAASPWAAQDSNL